MVVDKYYNRVESKVVGAPGSASAFDHELSPPVPDTLPTPTPRALKKRVVPPDEPWAISLDAERKVSFKIEQMRHRIFHQARRRI